MDLTASPVDKSALVVAPDGAPRRAWTEAMRQAGLRVRESERADAALEALRENPPDILIRDGALPDMDGLEFLRRARELDASGRLHILALLESADEANAHKALEAGADECAPRSAETREIMGLVRAGLHIAYLGRGLDLLGREFDQLKLRLKAEQEAVAQIQRELLPRAVPEIPGVDFSTYYLPSTECGGDYYDFLRLDDSRTGFVIADVSGHGSPATVAMAVIRQFFRFLARDFDQPHLLLEEMNRRLCDELPGEQYATMHYAILDAHAGRCLYASAGHNPPLRYSARDGRVEAFEGCEGFPLKLVARDAAYQTRSIPLEPGDKILFYTDGVTECFGPGRELYGQERLEEALRLHGGLARAAELQNAIATDLFRFSDNPATEDDLTLAVAAVLKD